MTPLHRAVMGTTNRFLGKVFVLAALTVVALHVHARPRTMAEMKSAAEKALAPSCLQQRVTANREMRLMEMRQGVAVMGRDGGGFAVVATDDVAVQHHAVALLREEEVVAGVVLPEHAQRNLPVVAVFVLLFAQEAARIWRTLAPDAGSCCGMKKDSPRLSVILPTYNCEAFLTQTLENVLLQLTEDCELIVVDDGSTDDTSRILKDYEGLRENIRIVCNEHSGASGARNKGLELAELAPREVF